ncbi:MAG: PTS sugar transporter subunit IIC [Elusimicrobia bacterium]|nr:PTS sugar transporter subunit IIC [Elusimicrobiota bacterium]
MIAWDLGVLPALCLVIAALELDNVHIGQWMLSRPILVGPVLGALCGVPWLGLAGGAVLELFCVDVLPVGNALPVNGTVAAASFVLLAAGPSAVPAAAAFPAALGLGSVFRRVENAVRSWRVLLAQRAFHAAEAGEKIKLGRVLFVGMFAHAAVTAVFLYATVAAAGPVLDAAWDWAPASARHGIDLAYCNAPWLGLAALLHALRPRG